MRELATEARSREALPPAAAAEGPGGPTRSHGASPGPAMNRLAPFCAPLFGLIALAALGGCNDPLARQEVSGEVTLKGQPVEDGVIQFAPLDGQGTGDGAQIVQGKYRIPKAKGLSPGKYRVAIYAGNGTSGEGNASPDSPNAGRPVPKERVPPAFNEKSDLVREVTKVGPNKIDFAIP